MDFEGHPLLSSSNDIAALEARITALETEYTTIQNEITTLQTSTTLIQNRISQLGQSSILPTQISTNSTTNVVMSNGMSPEMHIPFSECRNGMAFRIKVYGKLQCNPANFFRLYIANDSIGNYPFTTTVYWPTGEIPSTAFVWEFVIVFKSIALPVHVWSSLDFNYGKYYLENPPISSITADGLRFYIIASFQDSLGGDRGFEMNMATMERIAFGF